MNLAKLESERKKQGLKVSEIYGTLGISKAAYWRKTHGKSCFTVEEMVQIVELLHLATPEGIFFDLKVS